MNYTVEKTEKNKVKFLVNVTAEEWEKANQAAYNANKSKYSLQGFRKGHVPRKILENVYGSGLFFEDAFNAIVPEYYTEILSKEKDIFTVSSPDIDVVSIDDKGLVFTAVAAVKPEVKLGDYKSIKVEKPEYNVTEEDINKEIDKAVERASRLVNAEGRAAQKGDTVIIDYSGSTDGKKFEGGSASNQPLELGSGSFIPGFEEQVEGMNIGEEKDINVTFPDNYAPQLAGKDAVFAIKLNEIKVKELPEINDEFAKDVSEFDTLEQYKADIKAKLTETNEKKADSEYEDKILEAISEASEVDLPQAMIDSQIDSMVQEMEYRMMYQGMKMDDFLKYTNQTMESLRESYKEQAAKNVKARLVLEQIIKEENITDTQEEVDKKIAELAEQAKKSVEEYNKDVDERQLEYIKNQIVMDKLFAYLKSCVSA